MQIPHFQGYLKGEGPQQRAGAHVPVNRARGAAARGGHQGQRAGALSPHPPPLALGERNLP